MEIWAKFGVFREIWAKFGGKKSPRNLGRNLGQFTRKCETKFGWHPRERQHDAKGRDAAPADRNPSPAGRLFLETLLLLAGCTRLILAVLLVYGSPLELY